VRQPFLDAGTGSPRHRGTLVVFPLDEQGRPACRDGENKWHLLIRLLFPHLGYGPATFIDFSVGEHSHNEVKGSTHRVQ